MKELNRELTIYCVIASVTYVAIVVFWTVQIFANHIWPNQSVFWVLYFLLVVPVTAPYFAVMFALHWWYRTKFNQKENT